MQPVLLVVQFLLAVALIAVILLQRTAQDGGGLMGGGNTMGGLFTARGSANLLTRATAFLATLFILNSLALGFIASHEHQGNLVDRIISTAPAPAAPSVPVSGAPGGALIVPKMPPAAGLPSAPVSPAVPHLPAAKSSENAPAMPEAPKAAPEVPLAK